MTRKKLSKLIANILFENSWSNENITKGWCNRVASEIIDLLEANRVNYND